MPRKGRRVNVRSTVGPATAAVKRVPAPRHPANCAAPPTELEIARVSLRQQDDSRTRDPALGRRATPLEPIEHRYRLPPSLDRTIWLDTPEYTAVAGAQAFVGSK